ncbi:SRPBCC domain-containing protein [Actinopolyspora mzabensis]
MPGRQDIVLSRVFEAPRDIVFRACTEPTLVPRWWGPRHYNTTVERDDVVTGGSWCYLSRDEQGTEYRFHRANVVWMPRPSGRGGSASTSRSTGPAVAYTTGRACCSMYCRTTEIGAPPTDPAKYEPDHRRTPFQ